MLPHFQHSHPYCNQSEEEANPKLCLALFSRFASRLAEIIQHIVSLSVRIYIDSAIMFMGHVLKRLLRLELGINCVNNWKVKECNVHDLIGITWILLPHILRTLHWSRCSQTGLWAEGKNNGVRMRNKKGTNKYYISRQLIGKLSHLICNHSCCFWRVCLNFFNRQIVNNESHIVFDGTCYLIWNWNCGNRVSNLACWKYHDFQIVQKVFPSTLILHSLSNRWRRTNVTWANCLMHLIQTHHWHWAVHWNLKTNKETSVEL